MLFNKKTIYEVDPLFFFDSNKDGFGDFEGFLKKIDYIKELKIDNVLFPDIFNQESIIAKDPQVFIFDKYGNFKDLKKIIEKLKEINKNLIVEINLSNILNSAITKSSMQDLKSKDIYMFLESETNANYLEDKKINPKLESIKKIISFWTKLGLNDFLISNIDLKNWNKINFDWSEISNIYKLIKEINQNANIGIKSLFLDIKSINNVFKKSNEYFDFVVDSSFSLLGTNQKHPFDIMEKFNIKKLLKKIKRIKIKEKDKYFICLNNNLIGRVNSRWLDENNLINEANKSLIMFNTLLPYSSIVYYGDEIGTSRLKIENIEDFHDYEYTEKKRKLEFLNFKIDDYNESQKFISKINSQSIFMWNNDLNCGFSKKEKIFRTLPINHETHNLKNQYIDSNSIFNFFQKINEFKNKELINNVFDFKMKIKKDILSILMSSTENKKFLFIINLTNKTKKIKLQNNFNIVISTYENKKYKNQQTNYLLPYESLILTK